MYSQSMGSLKKLAVNGLKLFAQFSLAHTFRKYDNNESSKERYEHSLNFVQVLLCALICLSIEKGGVGAMRERRANK